MTEPTSQMFLLQCQVINSGGSGTVPAGLPQGETEQVSIYIPVYMIVIIEN